MKLFLSPITLTEAMQFVRLHHRHHLPPQGGLFAIACADETGVRGVAIVGRPVARLNQDGFTAEVTRVATDGAANACSMLYAASWRAARAMGYRRLITYTLQSEPGTSLRAAGWKVIGEVTARSWSTPSRPRVDKQPLQAKLVWSAR